MAEVSDSLAVLNHTPDQNTPMPSCRKMMLAHLKALPYNCLA
jgi:hypothetical protein